MSFIDERKERIMASNPQDEALASRILRSLSEIDREVISRFYEQRQTAVDIERDLRLEVGYVNQIKASVKVRFFEERRSSMALPFQPGVNHQGPHVRLQ